MKVGVKVCALSVQTLEIQVRVLVWVWLLKTCNITQTLEHPSSRDLADGGSGLNERGYLPASSVRGVDLSGGSIRSPASKCSLSLSSKTATQHPRACEGGAYALAQRYTRYLIV